MSGLISYIRVSTARQGKSGLGVAAQRDAIARFAEAEGREVIDTFVEIETGKCADALDRRPQPAAAVAAAKSTGSQSSSLDRLSRDVHFISGLMARAALRSEQFSVWLGGGARHDTTSNLSPATS
jgi:DNA invertase Pin-like site-specific DNA recombinase